MRNLDKTFAGILLMALMAMVSCQDFNDLLEKEDTGDIDLEVLYSDIRYADRALTDLYSRLPFYMSPSNNRDGKLNQSCMADAFSIYGNTVIDGAWQRKFVTGQWGPDVDYITSDKSRPMAWGDFYRFDYAAIRACDLFLENIERVPFDDEYGYGADEMITKKGEAIFLSAYFNFDLLRNFGGFTIVDRVLAGDDPEVKGARNTVDECVAHIVMLCNEASKNLPPVYEGSQLGRATQGAAMALKAKCLVYAASPLLNNPQKTDDSPFRGQYDSEKWKKAAEACADVIKLNQYTLVDDITKIFATRTNSESIFQIMAPMGWRWYEATLPPKIGHKNSNRGRNQMTYSLMKYYKVLSNGVAYDQEDPSGPFNLQDPYKNLDPRFYRDVAFNGANLRGLTASNGPLQIWRLGANTSTGDAAKNISSRNTWLYNIKMVNKDHGLKVNKNHSPMNFFALRYSDILLLYAEAINEGYGGPENDPFNTGLTATAAVNLIRKRTNTSGNYPEYLGQSLQMPNLQTGLSQDDFQKELRQERRVEMGFEDDLFYDIRRWKLSVEYNRTAELLVPELSREAPGGTAKITYKIEKENRIFESSWYLMPIPANEIRKNGNLVQNPGWEGSPESEN